MSDAYTQPVGVSVGLLRIIEEKAKKLGANPTTKEACTGVIMPETKSAAAAYIDLYRGKSDPITGKPYVGNATVFLSHAWAFPFETPLSVMYEHAEANPDAYFWFDLCVNNQHSAPSRSHDWWSTTFRTCIEKIGTVILCLAPWNDPIPLTRAWCLWEILCALDAPGVKFICKLPPTDVEAFHKGIDSNFRSAMDALVTTQAQKAQAFNPDDRKMIFAAIEETVGFDSLNAKVKDQMRNWFIETGEEMADKMEKQGKGGTSEFAHLAFNLGTMFKDFDAHAKSAHRFSQALSAKKVLHGDDSTKLAETYNNMAINFKKWGKVDEALEAYEHSLRLKLQDPNCGPNHPKTATTLNNMGNIYKNREQYAKAQDVYDRALKIRLEKLGPDAKVCASTWNNMGDNYRLQGDLQKAEDCLLEAMRIKVKCPELGPNHPGTVTTFSNLGKLYIELGRYEDALEMTNKSLRVRVTTLGKHKNTDATITNALKQAREIPGNVKNKRKAKAELKNSAGLFKTYLGKDDAKTKEMEKLLKKI